ncbi:MAG: fumarate hydratase [Candidatus Omnitrophica bacterium]|nr:fumarate hydratase [Candidatus Omnitrophota bacterium]
MRKIHATTIRNAVRELCIRANAELPRATTAALREAFSKERSRLGKETLSLLLENAREGAHERVPLCQDTGYAVFFVELGQEVRITGGSLKAALTSGVRQGYRQGFLRASIVGDPLLRKNTRTNTPCMIHYDIVRGDKLKILFLPKGGGGENASALKMLRPADGIAGAKQFVIETVRRAAAGACPPIVVGVGIGGTFDSCPLIAKKALLRPLGRRSKHALYARLERELLKEINNTGIGPSGFGGSVTALAVHVEYQACHIASLPVAVNIQCNAHRFRSITL